METKIGLPATLAGFEDRARFSIAVQEQTLGTMDVEWRPDGSLTSRSHIAYAGQTLERSLEIVPDEEGRWREIVCRLAAGTLTVTREGTAVTRRFGERTSTLETSEDCLIFDNEAPILISQALRRYDRVLGGAQKFPLLLAIKQPVELTLESLGEFAGDSGLTRFRYGVPGLDLYVVADHACRIYWKCPRRRPRWCARDSKLCGSPRPAAILSTSNAAPASPCAMACCSPPTCTCRGASRNRR